MLPGEELLLRVNRAVLGRFVSREAESVSPQVCYDRAQRDARRGYCLAVAAVLLIVGGNERLTVFGRSEATAEVCRNWASEEKHHVDEEALCTVQSHAVDEAAAGAAQLEAAKQALQDARSEAIEVRKLAGELEGRHLAELSTARAAAAAATQLEVDLSEARSEAAAATAMATTKTALLVEHEASAAGREAQLAQQADAARHALSLERASSAAASVAAFGEKAEAAQAHGTLGFEHCP